MLKLVDYFNSDMASRLFLFRLRQLDRMKFLRMLSHLGKPDKEKLHCNVFGIDFGSPFGLEPGLDADGLYYNLLSDLGLSFIITGPTGAGGVRKSIEKIKREKPHTVVMPCIAEDHATAFSLAYDFVDGFVVSAPDDQVEDVIGKILDIRLTYEEKKPVLLLIDHEIPMETLHAILDFAVLNGVDGFVAKTEDYIRMIGDFFSGKVPIIGFGEVATAREAESMMLAGASLTALSTRTVYAGRRKIKKILRYFEEVGIYKVRHLKANK